MGGDPRAQLMTFPLALGMDNVSHPEVVQPVGARPRHVLSRNMRLTKATGCVSKAPGVTTLAAGLTGPYGGLVALGTGDSSLLPCRVPASSKRIAGNGVGALSNMTFSGYPQSSYYPAQVTAAGVLPGSDTVRWNASCAYVASSGWTYFVTIRASGSALFASATVFLNVIDANGAEIVTGEPLVALGTSVLTDENFAAITAHGSTVVLWYAEDGAANLTARTVSVNTSTYAVTLGTQTVIYAPVGGARGPKQIQIAHDPTDSSNAYVAIQHSATAANVAVLRVAIPALTVTTSVSLAANTYNWVGIAYKSGLGVLVATSATGLAVSVRELNATTLATVWSSSGPTMDGVPSLGFQTYSGAVYRVLAVSAIGAGTRGTYVMWFDSAGANFVADGHIHQHTMVGHMVTLRHDDGTFDALITTQPCYSTDQVEDSYDPNDNGFLPDPSIEVWRTNPPAPGGVALMAYCVARLGTDMALRYPGFLNAGFNVFLASSSSCIDCGSQMLVTYLVENEIDGNVSDGYVVRYAQLDFRALQPRWATNADGLAIIAGALPVVWDGAQVTEFSPLRQPKILGTATGGGGGVPLPAGTYLFAVVLSWKDAAGTIHRSPPSNVITLSNGVNPLDPLITVYLPNSYRDLIAQPGYQVVIYASEVDDTTPYATRKWQAVTGITYTTVEASFNDPFAGTAGAFTPAIYTDGSETRELPAFCPNACLDAEIVADRLWTLDAERRMRWPYSKPKASGIFFEMNPDLYVTTPSSAGAGVAVSQWQGNPLFLTERGIWTCAGEGPDALFQPPLFSAAVQVSDVACTQRNSVVRSPAGVLFIANNRFVRFNGQLAEYPEIDATLYGNVVGTAVFRKQQEVVFFLAQGYAYVFNWLADAFTLWDTAVTGMSSITGCAQRADGKVLLVSSTLLRIMDPDTVSTDAQVAITTGHVQLGDKQDNNNLENFVLHAKRGGTHALGIVIGSDYVTPVDTKARDATQILDSTNSAGVYDLQGEPTNQAARAVQFQLTEGGAAGEGFQPISMTLEVIKKPGKAVRNLPDSARV